MRLHCLGTVGYHPNATRHTSCYFLPESGILLDAGSGTFRLAPLVQTKTLDILLSHAHLDHTLGLTFLLDVLYQLQTDNRPLEQLRIWGEAEKISAVRQHLFSELIFPVQLDKELGAQWCEIDELDEFTIGDAQVTWRRQQHPGGSVAYAIRWGADAEEAEANPDTGSNSGAGTKNAGTTHASTEKAGTKKLVYASDTVGDTSDEASRWAEGADLLMHECYFRDSGREWAEKTGHCWTSRLVEVANLVNPKKTLVTHVNPLETGQVPVEIEQIDRQVSGEVIVAEDGLVLDF